MAAGRTRPPRDPDALRESLLRVLEIVACANQLGTEGDIKRIFSQKDAEAALAANPNPEHLALFAALLNLAASVEGSGEFCGGGGNQALRRAGRRTWLPQLEWAAAGSALAHGHPPQSRARTYIAACLPGPTSVQKPKLFRELSGRH